jgi:hypothetical protein
MNEKNIKRLFFLAMAIAYVIMGVLVIQKQWFLVKLERNPSLVLGILLMAYGLFRGFRAMKMN